MNKEFRCDVRDCEQPQLLGAVTGVLKEQMSGHEKA